VMVGVGSVATPLGRHPRATPPPTRFIDTENELRTEFAAGYSVTVSVGEPQQLRVCVVNDEEQTTAHTVVTRGPVDQGDDTP
jgi:hypothetical protein